MILLGIWNIVQLLKLNQLMFLENNTKKQENTKLYQKEGVYMKTEYINDEGETKFIEKEIPYVEVSFYRSINRKSVKLFKFLMVRLLEYYMKNKEDRCRCKFKRKLYLARKVTNAFKYVQRFPRWVIGVENQDDINRKNFDLAMKIRKELTARDPEVVDKAIEEQRAIWNANPSRSRESYTQEEFDAIDEATREKTNDLKLDLPISFADESRRYVELAQSSGKDMSASVNESVAAYNLYTPQKLTLPGHDGQMVEGFLYLPPGANDDEKLPAIIEMHGGPVSRYGNAWSSRYPWQVLAKNGFAVFIVNPRGGTAYGIEFQRGVYRNFGTDDYKDIMAAVDALIERGTIDPDRLGFTGYSYGGMMTNVVISRTERFKAAVSIAGMWNYTSAMGQNNPQLFIDSYKQPWDGDLALMWEHSPASRANKISTPTLIMHGKDDEPVDPRQSIEMFSYLQLNGVPSRLVLYPGEGHGINQPAHMIDYQTRELQWFLHYVMGDEEAIGAEAAVPVEE